jgi:hypothetical protein
MSANSKPLPPPDVSVYRAITVGMLRRYFNMSVELGRLPSIIGREVFRSRVRCRPVSFENFVIYVLDVDRCLQRLRRRDQQLITRVVLQEYTQEEAARLLGWPVITVERRLPEVLDSLSETFLKLGLIKPFSTSNPTGPVTSETCARTPKQTSVAKRICASAEAGHPMRLFVSFQNKETEEVFRDVPVEIFLSSPLSVTNPANCFVP